MKCFICKSVLCSNCDYKKCESCRNLICQLDVNKAFAKNRYFLCIKCAPYKNPRTKGKHVHNKCIKRKLLESLNALQSDFNNWKNKYLEAYNTFGKGLLLFKDQNSSAYKMIYLSSQEMIDSLPPAHNFETNCLFAIAIFDPIFKKTFTKRRLI